MLCVLSLFILFFGVLRFEIYFVGSINQLAEIGITSSNRNTYLKYLQIIFKSWKVNLKIQSDLRAYF